LDPVGRINDAGALMAAVAVTIVQYDPLSGDTGQDAVGQSYGATMPTLGLVDNTVLYNPWPDVGIPTGPSDIVAPVVDNFVPVAGTQIAASDSIAFDVTDDQGSFARIFVGVEFVQSGDQEIAHDGTTFTGRYVQASTRVAIANGYRYTLRRLGGWTSAPKIRVWPIDTAGNAV
jgi:hypothetical protein